MLFPNSLALGGNLESINEPYYIRIPSWKIHIFGLNEITSFWNDSSPKTKNHLGPRKGVMDVEVCLDEKHALVFNCQYFFFHRNGRITWYKQRYRVTRSRMYLSHFIFSSGFLSIYMWLFLRAQFQPFFCIHWSSLVSTTFFHNNSYVFTSSPLVSAELPDSTCFPIGFSKQIFGWKY